MTTYLTIVQMSNPISAPDNGEVRDSAGISGVSKDKGDVGAAGAVEAAAEADDAGDVTEDNADKGDSRENDDVGADGADTDGAAEAEGAAVADGPDDGENNDVMGDIIDEATLGVSGVMLPTPLILLKSVFILCERGGVSVMILSILWYIIINDYNLSSISSFIV